MQKSRWISGRQEAAEDVEVGKDRKGRKGKGHSAVPAYEGSLAEAKRCLQPNLSVLREAALRHTKPVCAQRGCPQAHQTCLRSERLPSGTPNLKPALRHAAKARSCAAELTSSPLAFCAQKTALREAALRLAARARWDTKTDLALPPTVSCAQESAQREAALRHAAEARIAAQEAALREARLQERLQQQEAAQKEAVQRQQEQPMLLGG
eukprot:1159182-Pelagomonas_calceolata.AAC.3